MASKVYAVRVGRKPGIYKTWAEAEVLVKGYPGAKYKSFTSMAEAEAFMAGEGGSAASAKSVAAAVETDIVAPEVALENLKKVIIKDSDKGVTLDILDQQVLDIWSETTGFVNGLFEKAFSEEVIVSEFSNREDVRALKASYGMNLSDMACFDSSADSFDAVAFVDGGGNKVSKTSEVIDLGIENEKDDFISTKIVFGVVFCDLKNKKISLYRYVMNRAMEFKNFFRQSNVAGEELAALLAMYIAKKCGLERLAIYQDNNLPAKYFSGKFKKISHFDDAPAQIFMNESIKYLSEGMKINFLYVPSEHECQKKKDKKEKGMKMYEAQNISKLTFEQAEFFNGISDRLADFNI